GGRLAQPDRTLRCERHDRAHRHARESRRGLRPDLGRRATRSQGALPHGVCSAEPPGARGRGAAVRRGLDAARHRRAPPRVGESRLPDTQPAAPQTVRKGLGRAGAGLLGRLVRHPQAGRMLKNRGERSNTSGEMDLGLSIAATGMVAEQVREGQLSNDLANASTPGYKSDQAPQHSFGELLVSSTQGAAAVGPLSAGVAQGKTYTDMTPAAIQETGEQLDLAIQGGGFFAVQPPQGVRYTRDGQFTSTAAGILTDASGNPVLGQSGAQIKVSASGAVPATRVGR